VKHGGAPRERGGAFSTRADTSPIVMHECQPDVDLNAASANKTDRLAEHRFGATVAVGQSPTWR